MSTYSDADDNDPQDNERSGFSLIVLPMLWLLMFFLLPLAVVLKVALSDAVTASPPYLPVMELEAGWEGLKALWAKLDFETFPVLLSEEVYWQSLLNSLKIASISTIITLFIAYPMAYGMTRASRWRPVWLMLVIVPFLTSVLIRVYALMGVLDHEGMLNQWFVGFGLFDEPLNVLNTHLAVYIGMVYTYLPLMVLPLYFSLLRVEGALLEAARDLGCSRRSAFWRIAFPLSVPGVIVGCFLVFIPMLGEFLIPDLLGGSENSVISQLIWREFFDSHDWPMASTLSIALLLLLILPILFFQRRIQGLLQVVKP